MQAGVRRATVDSDQKLSHFSGVGVLAGGRRVSIFGIGLEWNSGLLPYGWECFKKSPHCRVRSSAARLDLTRVRSSHWPTLSLLPSSVLHKSILGELVAVCV